MHTSSLRQHVWALEGKDVLYVEKRQIYRVKVSRLREVEAGFRGTATPVRVHGLPNEKRPWKFGAAWNYLYATEGSVRSTYGGWTLYLDDEVFEELMAILAPLPAGCTYWDDFAARTTPGGILGNQVLVPGPVATEVLEFLKRQTLN